MKRTEVDGITKVIQGNPSYQRHKAMMSKTNGGLHSTHVLVANHRPHLTILKTNHSKNYRKLPNYIKTNKCQKRAKTIQIYYQTNEV